MVVCGAGSRHRTRNLEVVDVVRPIVDADECREVCRGVGSNLEVLYAVPLPVEFAAVLACAIAHRNPRAVLEVYVSRQFRICSA